MFLYLTPTSRIAYFTHQDATFLQSLEGTQLSCVETFVNWEATVEGCFSFRFDRERDEIKEEYLSPTERDADYNEAELLNRKCLLLHKVNRLVCSSRRPYIKNLPGQDKIYEKKYHEAVTFLEGQSTADALHFLRDESDVMKRDLKTVAHEIVRQRFQAEWVMRCSERARRALTEKICSAEAMDELDQIATLIIPRNFNLLFEV